MKAATSARSVNAVLTDSRDLLPQALSLFALAVVYSRAIVRGVSRLWPDWSIPMTRPCKTILCIDDHQPSLGGWGLFLQGAGYSVETACSAQEGLELFAVQPIDLVLVDYVMPELNGAEVAVRMKRIKPDVRIVLFSGLALPESDRAHVDAFIEKGEHPTVVLQKIDELLQAGEQAA